jgi:HEAT repeat protein
MRTPVPPHHPITRCRRCLALAALAVAATCRPPDLTASGGCIPWTEGEPGRPGPLAVAAAPADAVDVADAETEDAAGTLVAALPVLRVRVALRPGAPTPQADPVGRGDVFFSQLAAALGTRPLFEADPDVELLAENLARAAARRREDVTLSATRSSGLEPFLVASVGLLRPSAGAAVAEPTYIVGLTLVVRRAAQREAFDEPPAIRWELDLPARAVRSARLVGTVAQAIEARVQVEIDREVADGRDLLADPALAQAGPAAERRLFELGRVLYADLAAALAGARDEERRAAARVLARAGDLDLLDLYGRMLSDRDPEVRRAALDGLWRAAHGLPPAVGSNEGGLPEPEQAWVVPAGDTVCRVAEQTGLEQESAASPGVLLADLLEEVQAALADADPRVARAALVLLSELGDTETRSVVRTAMREADDPKKQDVLAVALGRLGDRSVAPRLRVIVGEAGDLASAAAATLGHLGDRSADGTLVALLGSPDATLRCAAAEALGGSRDMGALGLLVPLLAGGQPSPVSRAARATLVRVGEAANPLLAAALDGTDASVAWAAAETLGEIGSAKALEPLTRKLVGLDAVLRDYIVDALGRIGDVHALPALVAAFGGQPEYRNEAPILRAILLFGRRAVPVLAEALAADDADIRAGALEALVRLGETDHVAEVLPLLDDASALVRARAAAYFIAAKDERALDALAARLEDADDDAAAAAADALGAIGGDTARATLERAVGVVRAPVAAAVARALAAIGRPESVTDILDATAALSAYDRARLVEAIVGFGAVAKEPLVAALSRDRLRTSALEALDGLGAVVDAAVLSHYHADERPAVRELLARLLGRTDDPAALTTLETLLRDSSPAVREAAVGGAADLGGPEAARVLRSALAVEQDEWVARAIRRALLHLGSVP